MIQVHNCFTGVLNAIFVKNIFQPHLLGTEDLATVAAVMPSLSKGEANVTDRTRLHPLVFHPVVSSHTPWLVRHCPAEDATAAISNVHCLVIPAEEKVDVGISLKRHCSKVTD